jgi:hypothetical protein
VTLRDILRAVLGVVPEREADENDHHEDGTGETDHYEDGSGESRRDERRTGGGNRDETPSFDELSVVNAPGTKTESLERTLDRAESVLEDQLTDLSDVHDRAIRTVRIAVVLLGAAASVAKLTSVSIPASVWLKASGALLVASIAAGIFASSVSSADYGPGPDYVRPNIESGDANEEVYLELLEGYSEAIAYNRAAVNESERYLFVTQILLVSSIVLGSATIVVL